MQTVEAMARRRESIVIAAQHLLAHEDLSAFSIRKLATSAGVSVATIYNLIGDRNAVLFAVVAELTEQMRSIPETDLETSVAEAVEQRISSLLGFIRSRAKLLRSANLAFDQLSREPRWSADISDIAKQGEARYFGAVSRGIERGELRGDIPAQVMSEQIRRAYLHATMDWAYRRISLKQYKKNAIRSSLFALLADASEPLRGDILERISRY